MKKIIIPEHIRCTQECVTKQQIEVYFEDGGKAPSIKEQLIVKAFEITDRTRVLYESEEVALLYSEDQTGIYLSCFNKTDEEVAIEIPMAILELKQEYRAYCVLTSEEIGILNEEMMLQIPDGGVLLVKLITA